MTDNVAGMLAYITIIPAIIFLVMEPYNKNRFVRFHSFQNLFLHVAWFAIWIAFVILSAVLAFIPILGHLVTFFLWLALVVGLLHHLDHPAAEGKPGPDVQAARDRRLGGKASERDVGIAKPSTTKDTKSHEGNTGKSDPS